MKMKDLILFAAVWSLAVPGVRAEDVPGISASSLDYAQRISMHSEILDENRMINVFLPESFHESSEEHRYPLIILMGSHGDRFFLTTAGIVQHLASVDRMPDSIVISFHRARYYAPNVYTNGMWSRETIDFNADPAKFIEHLEKELFPYFREHYRALDARMIVGVSGSSIFPLHAFAKAPGLFDTHVILAGADMIGMGYEAGKTFIDAFEDSFAKSPERQARLYMAIAGDDLIKEDGYRANLEELERRLAPFQAKNLDLKVEVIPDEGHYDAYIKALLSAIDRVYPKKKWSPKFRDMIAKPGDALANIDAYHRKLSEEYGFPILPNANRWNSVNCLRWVGGKLRRDGRVAEAISVLERWVEYRPRSAWALHSLSEALEAGEKLQEAIAAQEKAVELAKVHDPEDLSEYQERLSELKARVSGSAEP